ncbi:MAG: putative N-acyltransferase [Oceanicoccus sp.]|jgi:predicted N-acyltransferase
MRLSFIDSITAISAAAWNEITGIDYPFTRHEFLAALELSNASVADSGWQAHHLLAHDDNDQLIAVMPLYLKFHSYGEYVFDWAWSDAYKRHNVEYYPKLLSAIPFTPATGPRLCIKDGEDKMALYPQISQQLLAHAKQINVSSLHILFPQQAAKESFQAQGLSPRRGVQYHWFNQGYSSFSDFVASFSSRKRKNLNKERRQVTEQGLRLEIIEGPNISADSWRRFFHFYQLTYAKRSGHGGYLNKDFFERLAATMPEQLVLVLAYDEQHGEEAIAGALNFRDSKTLYGRYWGCIVEHEFLHFEACYYQGIEYCIAKGLQRFDPGAQGEHKIQRGFTPTETWSNHWIANPEFRHAIDDFLERDNDGISQYIEDAQKMLPFKKSDC